MSRSPSSPAGPSQRVLRVGELIRRNLSEILAQGGLHDPDLDGVPITVGEVRVSADLRVATAYVLPLGGANRDGILAALRRSKPEIRHQIGRGLTLRHVPDLRFEIDETFDRIEATRRMFADERVRRDIDAAPSETRPSDESGDAAE
ncbi:30S ribosome-binding factor RbfA [Rubellimicrobium aerolatum]|uniref:Ribosome-binding factor A n=1 Tax=Rubellimicrobium aerolatum TaxID=490979 RepID=A0ABW0SHG6_9RHOB|nr:30S ribosome-binding factor RbfA [Rubellimicrobium aerolatum]MBP1806643.1 ribosome-binding factor A [Rubellimicrobium aerolatum]